MHLSRNLLLLLLLNFHSILNAQNHNHIPYKRCSVKTLNFEQGLLNNSTNNIITDNNGFTWVSTFTGMQRYNGYALEQINPVINNEAIEINSPVFFFALQNGNIWISYKQGVLEYSPYNNSFKKITGITVRSNLFFSIVPLGESSEGIWYMQENKGIVIYNAKSNISKIIYDSAHVPVNLMLNSTDILYKNFIATNNIFIFIRTSNNNILRINKNDHVCKNIKFSQDVLGLACNADKLFILSYNNLLSIKISDNSLVKEISFDNFLTEKVGSGTISASNTNYLLVSINRHLFEFDTLLNNQKEFTTLNRNIIVPTGDILLLYSDKFKRIWLLTNNDIKRIENVNVPFDHFIYTGEKNNFVRSLYYDEQKHVLIAGCYNGTIQLYDTLANPLWQKLLVYEPAGYILSIEKLSANEYLLQTFGNGLFLLNLQKKKIEPYAWENFTKSKPQIRSTSFPNNSQRINDSTIFICTAKNVFRCILKKDKIISVEALLSYPNPPEGITCFIYTSEKSLWSGTGNGTIYRLEKNGSSQTLNIPGNYAIRCFTETADHHIWAGTNKGIYIYNFEGKLTASVTTKTGLLNDCIYALLPKDSNTVFASSNLGLSYINENGSAKNFSKELGLQENEFNNGAAVKTSSGKFYFGGVNGISAFYPNDLSKIKDTPVLNITRFVVNDSLINPPTPIWKRDTISLRYYQNHLEFDLAALGLLNNNDYVYKYRLKGFEERWQSTHQPTGIKYNLEPGNYTLEILCSPVLTDNTVFKKNLTIIIHPPWWQTWWLRSLAAFIILGFIFLIVQQYNRRKYIKKITEMRLQHQIQNERERISRDLHDNIGAQLSYISSNIDWMVDAPVNKEEENKRMISINETAKNAIHNLRETIWALNRESIYIDELADKLKLFIHQQLQLNKKIINSFREDHKTAVQFTPNEALNIYRICQEVISNAIKHSGCTELSVKVESYSPSNFAISITDNGKGFNIEEKHAQHYGLINMQHRAEEAGVILKIESKNNDGTKVVLTK